MVESIGIDIAEVARFKGLMDRYGQRLIARVLGPHEIEILAHRHDRAAFMAGRFAAKEALIKALGKYIEDRPPLNSLEILNDQTGRPKVHLPTSLASRLAHVSIEISISHEQSYAIGLAVCMEKL